MKEEYVVLGTGVMLSIASIEKLLLQQGCKVLRTGSQVIGGVHRDSDTDIVVFSNSVPNWIAQLYRHLGIELNYGGSIGNDLHVESWKDGSLNIIVALEEDTFNRWSAATKVATALELVHKPARVACFQYFRTNGVDELTEAVAVPW